MRAQISTGLRMTRVAVDDIVPQLAGSLTRSWLVAGMMASLGRRRLEAPCCCTECDALHGIVQCDAAKSAESLTALDSCKLSQGYALHAVEIVARIHTAHLGGCTWCVSARSV